MEIFVDFGLFEILAASGLGTLGRAINRHPFARALVLVLSIAAPGALLWLVGGETLRWIAALALGTSLVNASIIVSGSRTLPAPADAPIPDRPVRFRPGQR